MILFPCRWESFVRSTFSHRRNAWFFYLFLFLLTVVVKALWPAATSPGFLSIFLVILILMFYSRFPSGDAWFFFILFLREWANNIVAQSTMTCRDVLWFLPCLRKLFFPFRIGNFRSVTERDLSVLKKCQARNTLRFAIFSSSTGECLLSRLNFTTFSSFWFTQDV